MAYPVVVQLPLIPFVVATTHIGLLLLRISCHLDWHQIVINDGSLTTDAALTITSLFVAFIAFCVPLTRLRSILDLTLSQWLKIYGKLSQFASVANFESSKSQFMLNSDR